MVKQFITQTCINCAAPLAIGSRYCAHCGTSIGGEAEINEILIPSSNRIQINQDMISLRELLAMVEVGVSWWKQKLQDAEGINRERAAAAIKDLSRILDSLSQQLAQGREMVRITTRLPTIRTYAIACSACGRGNRSGARFCLACGAPLPDIHEEQVQPGLRLHMAAQSDVGRVRKHNEDVCYVGQLIHNNAVWATLLLVADGMGGEKAGAEASRLANETIQKEFKYAVHHNPPHHDTDWQSLLRHGVLVANRTIYLYARANGDKRGMGTTLTVVIVTDKRAYIAHVGDSRAYLINANGVTNDGSLVIQLTSDHSLVARLVDIGQLTLEQARIHPHRNILYRSLGPDPQLEIDISSQPIDKGDVLLLCSDGLTNHVRDTELAQITLSNSEPLAICKRLITLANSRGGYDNISVVVAKIECPTDNRHDITVIGTNEQLVANC